MSKHEEFVDGNAAVLEEMEATPKLKEESPSERMLSSEVAIDVEQARPPESQHDIIALEGQGVESDEEEADKEVLKSNRRSCFVKIIIGLLLLGFVLFLIIDTTTNGYVKDGIEEFLEWIEDHPIGGVFLFMIGTCRNFFMFVASAVGHGN
jgi:hypothetical protein